MSLLGVKSDMMDDTYRFDLAAGQSASVALTSLATDNTTLALYDSQYRLLAKGAAAADAGQTIDHFVSQSGGTYYVCITGGGAPYSLVVTKDAAFNQQSTQHRQTRRT